MKIKPFLLSSCLVALVWGIGTPQLPVRAQTPVPPQTQASRPDDLGYTVRIPMILLSDFRKSAGNDPMIMCRLGERTYWFSIDTASDRLVLKRSVQQEAGLEVADHPDFDLSNLAEREKPYVVDGRVLLAKTPLAIGTLNISGVPFTISNDDHILKSDKSVAGIVGAPLFRKMAVSFDYDQREMTLVTGGNLDAKKRAELGFTETDARVDLVPFSTSPNVLAVKVRCNGKDLTLALDTGASNTVLQVPARDLGVKLPETSDGTVIGVFGKRDSKSAEVSLSLSDLPPQQLPALFLEGDQKVDFIQDGTLGRDFLMHYNFLIDFPAKKLYLRPRSNLKRDK